MTRRWALVVVALVVGCGGTTSEPVVVGAYPIDESRTLAAIVEQVLVAQGAEVTMKEYSSRDELMAALDEGEADVVVEYMASLLAFYGHAPAVTDAEAIEHLDAARPGMSVAVAPAHAGRGLAVRAEFSGDRGVASIAGLSEFVDRMVVGGPSDCPSSPTCLFGLEAIYGFRFEAFAPYDEADVLVAALEEGLVDAAVLFVTDPLLVGRDLVVLEDDLGMHGRESPVVLAAAGALDLPSADAISDVWSRLDTAALRDLNAAALRLGRDVAVGEFLTP